VSVCSEAEPGRSYAGLLVSALILLAVVLVFGRTVLYEFINYDDPAYVYQNPRVSAGLTSQGIAWAFTSSHAANWHPLTWVSHMADCQVYGLRPWGHHLGNVLLHAATAILLFLVLSRMTRRVWPSAFVAAVFAVHPLRVESVAWVAERKDVLSGLLFVLTLQAYASYVERPASWGRYLAVVVFFVLGLLAKPMLVTVPFVLLLLDFWPLGRMESPPRIRFGRLVIEKIPLLLLAVGSCVMTIVAQRGAIRPLELVPLSWRIGNALVSYVSYLWKFVCPMDLVALYPHPGDSMPAWQVATALLVLLGISLAALAMRRQYPYWLVGWLWYVGMLVPVIGLVQVGPQAMADRYTYLPQIGLSVALAWGVADVTRFWPNRRWLLSVSSLLVVAILMGCAWRQTDYWRSRESLWTHTLACYPNNAVAHNNLGEDLDDHGRTDEAIAHLRQAVEIDPNYARAHNSLGATLAKRDLIDEAMVHFRKAIDIAPDFGKAHSNLGAALAKRGQTDEAIVHFRKAVDIDPDLARAHGNLGLALTERGLIDEAIVHFRQAVEIEPDYVQAHSALGKALARRGLIDEAADQFQEALRIKADYGQARRNLDAVRSARETLLESLAQRRELLKSRPGDVALLNETAWLLATNPNKSLRNGIEAVEFAQRAVRASVPQQPAVLGTLAAAYAETGRFADAVTSAQKAFDLASAEHNVALANALREQIGLYRAGLPCRQMQQSPQPERLPIGR
jgi:protein O-mannosyl-transferase